MNRSETEGKSGSHSTVSSTTTTRLAGFWLIVARAAWLVLVVPSLGLFVVGLPVYDQQLQRAQTCGPADCLFGGLTTTDLQTLSAHGIPVSSYAAVFIVFFVLTAVVWLVVGFLLFWRRSDDSLALLASFTLVMNGVAFGSSSLYALVLTFPIFDLPVSLIQFLGSASIPVFLLFFPTGRLVPRWIGPILPLIIGFVFVDTLPSTGAHFDANWPGWLSGPGTIVLYGAIIFSQLYRYRRVSTPVQRQQTKWVVFGVTVALGTFVGLLVISGLFPSFPTLFANAGWTITLPIASLAVPLSIGFSILRYRLYDIDVLINRTMVYGTLTASLALVYVGLVIGFSALLRGMISQDTSVAIVISTLASAALFGPLRQRIQWIIDRRFYRSKYDAAKTVAAFSATLRQEVDLDQLREQMLAVVQETMQPAHISLWVRSPDHHGQQRAPWRANPPVLSEEG